MQESTGSKVKAVENSRPLLTYKEGQQWTGMENGYRQSVSIKTHTRSSQLLGPHEVRCLCPCMCVCVCCCTGHRSKFICLASDSRQQNSYVLLPQATPGPVAPPSDRRGMIKECMENDQTTETDTVGSRATAISR